MFGFETTAGKCQPLCKLIQHSSHRHINLLEAVDPAEASTRISLLLTQIETAYSLTARIQRLSLLNYL